MSMKEWLATRPESVQRLAAEFPAGSSFSHEGTRYWIIGWTESDLLIISTTSPHQDYEKAVATKEYCHAHCLRGGKHETSA